MKKNIQTYNLKVFFTIWLSINKQTHHISDKVQDGDARLHLFIKRKHQLFIKKK